MIFEIDGEEMVFENNPNLIQIYEYDVSVPIYGDKKGGLATYYLNGTTTYGKKYDKIIRYDNHEICVELVFYGTNKFYFNFEQIDNHYNRLDYCSLARTLGIPKKIEF